MSVAPPGTEWVLEKPIVSFTSATSALVSSVAATSVPGPVVSPRAAASTSTQGGTAADPKTGGKSENLACLADSAKCEVYGCFEGPLGAHLKAEVREKIWKDEYMELFMLPPLEKFNLDR